MIFQDALKHRFVTGLYTQENRENPLRAILQQALFPGLLPARHNSEGPTTNFNLISWSLCDTRRHGGRDADDCALDCFSVTVLNLNLNLKLKTKLFKTKTKI